jgi:hypothetical protein
LKNHIPRKEVATMLFFLKLAVFEPSIIMPYDPHKRQMFCPTSNDAIYGKHTPSQKPPF